MQQSTQIGTNQFATIAVNLLHRGIIEADRTTAKRIFRALEEGRTVTLTNLRMEDGGMIRVDLTLNAEAFNGTLNFSAWRDGVLALIAQMSDELRAGNAVPLFHPIGPEEKLPGDIIGSTLYGTLGATVHGETLNTLMMAVRPDPAQAAVTLQLQYVDPNQFAAASSSGSSSS